MCRNHDYLINLKSQNKKLKEECSMSVVTTVQKEIESLKNSIKREKAIESNIFDMTAVIEHIAELKEASEPMAEESPYETYEEWQAAAEKELKGYQSSLATIAENKEILVALETYISEHPEGM
jgi:uncharacterized protein (UPF0305 family)